MDGNKIALKELDVWLTNQICRRRVFELFLRKSAAKNRLRQVVDGLGFCQTARIWDREHQTCHDAAHAAIVSAVVKRTAE